MDKPQKTTTMKNGQNALMIGAIGALFLTACGRQPGNETERVTDQMNENKEEVVAADNSKEWMNEREEASKELADLRENLDDRLIREEKRLADGIKNAERKAECTQHIAELKMNIARIDGSMGTMKNSTSGNWQKVKADNRMMADSTRNWFDRQAENIDRRTDMDSDKDGK